MMPEDEGRDRKASAEALENGRWLFAQACEFVAGARIESQLPAPELNEVAFAGRSNVGKSSLLNALTGRRTLARTSHTPGRTREVNFFNLGGRLMLVDLPGYGYARASKTEIARWNQLIRDYLRGRANLRRVCLLLDSRHGIKPPDLPVMDLLDEAAVSYQAVLTKIDKLKPAALAATLAAVQAEFDKRPAAYPEIIATSASAGTGVAELRATLATLADQ
jgi:GTP-binding protein